MPVLFYLLFWVVSIALAVLDILLLRTMLLEIAAWYASRAITTTAERIEFNFRISFIDRGLLFLMAIAGLAVVIALEHRYRALADRQELVSEGWKPVAILAGIGLISLAVRLLL